MMKHKLIIPFIAVCLFVFTGMPDNARGSNSIKWVSYTDAKKLEKNNTNKVFIYFYSMNCPYCALMEKNTFSNATITRYLNQNFIPIRVNSDKERNIANDYNVRGNPTNYFLTETFDVIGHLPGYLPPEDLLDILKYIHSDSYKKMTLPEFIRKTNQ